MALPAIDSISVNFNSLSQSSSDIYRIYIQFVRKLEAYWMIAGSWSSRDSLDVKFHRQYCNFSQPFLSASDITSHVLDKNTLNSLSRSLSPLPKWICLWIYFNFKLSSQYFLPFPAWYSVSSSSSSSSSACNLKHLYLSHYVCARINFTSHRITIKARLKYFQLRRDLWERKNNLNWTEICMKKNFSANFPICLSD